MTTRICMTCRGNKVIYRGGMPRGCPGCQGKGSVEVIEAVNVAPAAIVTTPEEIKPSLLVAAGETPSAEESLAVQKQQNKEPVEQELGRMYGFTPFMVEAIMREPSMKPEEWQRKYASVILPPLSMPKPGVLYVPDLQSRAKFRENVAKATKPAPRKHNTMKTHDLAGKLEGIE